MEYNIQGGFEKKSLDTGKERALILHVPAYTHASLLVNYHGEGTDLAIELNLEEQSSLTVMFKNDGMKDIHVQMKADVYKDASLTAAFCELNEGNTKADISVNLLETGAYAMLRSACIVKDKKDFMMQCDHKAPYTQGYMENYAVVESSAAYRMEAIGKIIKGAYESNSHQKTRVLTMSENHNTEVIPVLLIDENKVKASHATTVGQPDENQLYYLQTRGLSRTQALGLLTVGYIMPIAELFDDEEIRNELKNEIEMKVGLHA